MYFVVFILSVHLIKVATHDLSSGSFPIKPWKRYQKKKQSWIKLLIYHVLQNQLFQVQSSILFVFTKSAVSSQSSCQCCFYFLWYWIISCNQGLFHDGSSRHWIDELGLLEIGYRSIIQKVMKWPPNQNNKQQYQKKKKLRDQNKNLSYDWLIMTLSHQRNEFYYIPCARINTSFCLFVCCFCF